MIDKFRRGEQGQALVEMALVLPLFFLLMFGVIEMGRIGYAYITVCNAVREGGRTASIGGTDSDITNAIDNAAPVLDPSNLTITINPPQGERQSGQDVTIEASYPVQLIIPVISSLITNPFIVSSTVVMRME